MNMQAHQYENFHCEISNSILSESHQQIWIIDIQRIFIEIISLYL